jgi:stage III sporulation protein AF
MLNWLSGDWLINGLSSYVRNLVLVVFLVNFFEMLAPENAMKRFVQVVAGFVVIVAMLQPLLTLVDKGKSGLDRASWSDLPTEYRDELGGPGGPAAAVELDASNSARALRLVKSQVDVAVEAEVQRARPGAVTQVELGASSQDQPGSVKVTISEGQATAASTTGAAGGVRVAVEPVKPIGRGVPARLSREPISGSGEPMTRDGGLEKAIADRLGLAVDQVQVLVQPLAAR